jgi:hypothetical protein
MGRRPHFVEIPWNGSEIKNMGRVFNKTNNSEINIYCSNNYERIRWQNMKDAQVEKQVEYIKQTQQSHYGPPQLQDRTYDRNDNNK